MKRIPSPFSFCQGLKCKSRAQLREKTESKGVRSGWNNKSLLGKHRPVVQPVRAGWRSWNLSLDRAELHQPQRLRWENEGKTKGMRAQIPNSLCWIRRGHQGSLKGSVCRVKTSSTSSRRGACCVEKDRLWRGDCPTPGFSGHSGQAGQAGRRDGNSLQGFFPGSRG